MKKLSILVVFCVVLSTQIASAYVAGIALFEETHFKGNHVFIKNDWTCENYNNICFSIESIWIPDGWEVWLYEDAGFRGEVLRLTSSWNGVDHNGYLWRDDIRSIRIVRKPMATCHHGPLPSTLWITVFEHDFDGARLKLNRNWTIGGSEGFTWNDRISSIHVPEGMTVRAYEHADFGGRHIDIQGYWKPRSWDDFWNDRISSIRIMRH